MRKVYIEGISVKYYRDLGPNTFLIEAVLHMPESQSDGANSCARINGKRLKEFLLNNNQEEIIKDLIDDEIYEINALDW